MSALLDIGYQHADLRAILSHALFVRSESHHKSHACVPHHGRMGSEIEANDPNAIGWMAQELKSIVAGQDSVSIPTNLRDAVKAIRGSIEIKATRLDQLNSAVGNIYEQEGLDIAELRGAGADNIAIFGIVKDSLEDPGRFKKANQYVQEYQQIQAEYDQELDEFCRNKQHLKHYLNEYYGLQDETMSGYVHASSQDGIPHWIAKHHEIIIVVLDIKLHLT